MADKKTIEFVFSGGDDGDKPGRSLVPVNNQSRDLTPEEKQKAEKFGELLGASQAEAYSKFFGEFFEEFVNFFGSRAQEAQKAQDDIIEGEYEILGSGGGGSGNDPNDPFAFMDEPYGRGKWFQDFMDELQSEYNAQAELLDKINEDYDELTQQTDALLEADEELLSTTTKLGLAFLAVVASARLFQEAVEDMTEMVGPFSAETNLALTEGRIQQLEDQIRAADEIGSQTADLTRIQNEIAREFRNGWREFYELIAPLLEILGQLMVIIVTTVSALLTVVNDIFGAIGSMFEFVAELIPEPLKAITNYLPTLGNIHKLIQKIKGNQEQDLTKTTNEVMDKLFGPDDIPFDPADIKENVTSGKTSSPVPKGPGTGPHGYAGYMG